jgi:hypothetical protein
LQKKLTIVLLLLFGLTISRLYSQESNSVPQGRNSVYGDFLVLFFINNFQVNYERCIVKDDNSYTSIRVGVGSWTEWEYNGLAIPIDIHFVLFKTPIHPEISIGMISFYDINGGGFSKPDLLLGGGIRYQRFDKGGFIRFKYEYCNYFPFMPGLSIGYNF